MDVDSEPAHAEAQQSFERVRLSIREIALTGPHGVYPHERIEGNRFSVDVELVGAFGTAVRTDRLEETIDYEQIVDLVREINDGKPFNLIESFAGAIVEQLIARFSLISQATVRVRKVVPKHLGEMGAAEVEVTRSRS